MPFVLEPSKEKMEHRDDESNANPWDADHDWITEPTPEEVRYNLPAMRAQGRAIMYNGRPYDLDIPYQRQELIKEKRRMHYVVCNVLLSAMSNEPIEPEELAMRLNQLRLNNGEPVQPVQPNVNINQ